MCTRVGDWARHLMKRLVVKRRIGAKKSMLMDGFHDIQQNAGQSVPTMVDCRCILGRNEIVLLCGGPTVPMSPRERNLFQMEAMFMMPPASMVVRRGCFCFGST